MTHADGIGMCEQFSIVDPQIVNVAMASAFTNAPCVRHHYSRDFDDLSLHRLRQQCLALTTCS
jgi:hypothetical protein